MHRINVQGGGILRCTRLDKALNSSRVLEFSMKWVNPVSERKEDCKPTDEDQEEGFSVCADVLGIARGTDDS